MPYEIIPKQHHGLFTRSVQAQLLEYIDHVIKISSETRYGLHLAHNSHSLAYEKVSLVASAVHEGKHYLQLNLRVKVQWPEEGYTNITLLIAVNKQEVITCCQP